MNLLALPFSFASGKNEREISYEIFVHLTFQILVYITKKNQEQIKQKTWSKLIIVL